MNRRFCILFGALFSVSAAGCSDPVNAVVVAGGVALSESSISPATERVDTSTAQIEIILDPTDTVIVAGSTCSIEDAEDCIRANLTPEMSSVVLRTSGETSVGATMQVLETLRHIGEPVPNFKIHLEPYSGDAE